MLYLEAYTLINISFFKFIKNYSIAFETLYSINFNNY